ncbi:MAG: hypothetical protein EVA58_04545 [Kiritimatiellaceae bacterium]|nr:MAG: hypothetical protein EVA58_04545 [Kiritimatiellaceae bacterium]
MKTRHPILLALLLLGTLHADVDSTFFHPAASAFIHGEANTASNKVAQGLQQYPNDPKLQRLKELLEQQQENEDQQDQQDNQNQQDPSNDPQDPQDPQQQQNDSENNPNNDPSDPSDSPPNTTPPPQAEEMTPEEAQQLLDAMRQDEENKRSQLRPIMGAPVRVEKDW